MGTVTVSEVAEAPVTWARTAPKKTMLLAAVELKFVPEITTVADGLVEIGAKEVMTGTPAGGERMVREAFELRTEPPAFEILQEYDPACEDCTFCSVRLVFVAPPMSVPLNRHW